MKNLAVILAVLVCGSSMAAGLSIKSSKLLAGKAKKNITTCGQLYEMLANTNVALGRDSAMAEAMAEAIGSGVAISAAEAKAILPIVGNYIADANVDLRTLSAALEAAQLEASQLNSAFLSVCVRTKRKLIIE